MPFRAAETTRPPLHSRLHNRGTHARLHVHAPTTSTNCGHPDPPARAAAPADCLRCTESPSGDHHVVGLPGSDKHAEPDKHADPDAHPRPGEHACSETDGDNDAGPETDDKANDKAVTGPEADRDGRAEPRPDSDADGKAHGHTVPHRDAHGHAVPHPDAHAYAHPDRNSDANPNPDAHADPELLRPLPRGTGRQHHG